MENATLIKFYVKGTDRPLHATLRTSELDCHCKYYSCKRTLLTKVTEASFLATREEFGARLNINSGFRCQKHNDDVGGAGDSRHKLGLALDLSPSGYRKLDLAPDSLIDLDKLEIVARKHFDVVIRYETFIHCHNLGGLE